MIHHVRRCTVMDLYDMLRIATECYPSFNQQKSVEWAESAMMDPKFGFFRTDNAWGCAVLARVFYDDKLRAAMMFLAARGGKAWEAVAVLKAMVEWSRGAGASQFSFGEDTGMQMETLAKRVGAVRERPAFRVDFDRKSSMLSTFWTKAA